MLTWQFQFDFIIVSLFRNGSTAGLEDREKEVIAWCSLAKVSSVSAFRQGVTRAVCSEHERFGNLWRTWRKKKHNFGRLCSETHGSMEKRWMYSLLPITKTPQINKNRSGVDCHFGIFLVAHNCVLYCGNWKSTGGWWNNGVYPLLIKIERDP